MTGFLIDGKMQDMCTEAHKRDGHGSDRRGKKGF